MLFSDIVIASSNINKINHIRNMIKVPKITVRSMKELSAKAPEETGDTYTANALIKARSVFLSCGFPALGDDSGFEIECLQGFPGIVSARFAGACGGYPKAFEILNKCAKSGAKASFKTALAFVYKDTDSGKIHEKVFTGEIVGNFVYPPRGRNGFGYCPCFAPDGFAQTFSEMSEDMRESMNHRFIALNKFVNFLNEQNR